MCHFFFPFKSALRILESKTSLDSKIQKLFIYKTKTITPPISSVLHLPHFTFSPPLSQNPRTGRILEIFLLLKIITLKLYQTSN